MNLNKKRVFIVSVVIAILGIFGIMITFSIIKANISNSKLYIFGRSMNEFEKIIKPLLMKFYNQLKIEDRDNLNRKFIKYVEGNVGTQYSSTPPVEGYTHPYDFCIHFMLPQKLYSEKPVIIAYSSYEREIEKSNKNYQIDKREAELAQTKRIVLFLYKSNLEVGFIEKGILEKIMDGDMAKKKPDVFFWWLKGEYEAP